MMIRLVLVFLLLIVTAAAEPLNEYRWKHRLLLVFGEADDSRDLVEFRTALYAARCELEERDLVVGWFLATAPARIGNSNIDDRQAQAIRKMAQPSEDGVTVLLVGKDGGVKSRYNRAPSLNDIFAEIDGMPMRRAEMRSRVLNEPDDVCTRNSRDGDPGSEHRADPKQEQNE